MPLHPDEWGDVEWEEPPTATKRDRMVGIWPSGDFMRVLREGGYTTYELYGAKVWADELEALHP